ncbi:MAG TPA: hypothetical protein VGO50_03515 [Pyrinomonadaceae bacterium]|jgi:hypothetical protein|nr:hypothetical protein [Pyrinomonadaceae bacterium]
MASIYTSTYTPITNVGPPGGSFTPITGLDVLSLNDSFLSDGGTALISLYLGLAAGSGDGQFFVNIEDIAAGYTVISALMGGGGNISGLVNISAVYNIPPIKTPPQLQATWTILGGVFPDVLIIAPTLFTFSAQVYPASVSK